MKRRLLLAGAAGSAAVLMGSRAARAQALPELPAGFTRLRAVEGTLTVGGKTGKAYRIEQEGGTLGYVGVQGERFRVAVENATGAPLSIHWHGLVLPNGQDGVPYVTQAPIKPGERRLYDFPIVQAGTYWMHSHYGLQEQPMMTAPLILRDPQGAGDEQDVVVMLNDFTVRDPAAILAELRGRGGARPESGRAGAMESMPPGGTPMTRPEMGGMSMGRSPRAMRGPDLVDVRYNAMLANRRPLSDPEVVRVSPGSAIRLRVINMASASNFFLRTGRCAPRPSPWTARTSCPSPGAPSSWPSPSASTCGSGCRAGKVRTRSSRRRRGRTCRPASYSPPLPRSSHPSASAPRTWRAR